MKRTLWTLLLALGAALALCVGAGATNQNDLFDALETGSIQLENDLTYSGLLNVYKNFTIDLNGHVLEIPGGIYVKSGAHLTITDSSAESVHYFDKESSGLWKWKGTDATEGNEVKGGVITGGTGAKDSKYGGGIYVAPGGTLTMSGGSIVGCSADRGGGVYVDDGATFTMSGSSAIIGCAAGDTGGGVLVEEAGTFTMNNSSAIRDCTAGTGGGVTVNGGESSGQFFMNGGRITGCKATNDTGGGGGILNDGAVTMTDGEITNCTASHYPNEPESGGVLNRGPFTMSDGTIGTATGTDCTIINIGSIRTVFTISGKAEIYADIINCCSKLYADGGNVYGTVKNGHQNYSNPGTITGSSTGTGSTTFHDNVENVVGTISGGTFENDVINGDGCTISGGKFNENVNNNGTIEGGDFRKYVTNNGTIKAAEDGSGPSFTSEVINNGTISGGEFTGSGYVTNYGTISGGTFSDTRRVSNNTGGTITGGTFNGLVTNSGGKITGGDFAKLEGAYRVEFVSDGSAAAAPQYVSRGDKLTKPADPSKDGYTFGGWYKDDTFQTPWDFENGTVTETITLYAKWTRKSSGSSKYAISVLQAENGSVTVSPERAAKGRTVTITAAPHSGYVLDSLTAADKNGNILPLTDLGGGKFTFTMPAGRVEVKAGFAAERPISPFDDVAADAYYCQAVKWAAERGITDGVGGGLFGSDRPCTREQIVTFLWRAAGSPVVNYIMPFPDVDESAWYAEAVRWAASEGITAGKPDGTFGVGDTCTRAQSVTFLFRAMGVHTRPGGSFSDVPAGSWFAAAVEWAAAAGVTDGMGGGLFAPDLPCTRAQIVTFLYQACRSR